MSLPLATAEKIAAKIVYELAPFCEQVEIAGSIRRRRPTVSDIDLVVLPKPAHAQAMRDRCKQKAIRVQTDAQSTLVFNLFHPPSGPDGLQVDIWIADHAVQELFHVTPSNWGTLLLCRTGSARHNIHLCSRALQLGVRWNPHQGVYDGHGNCLGRATEQEVFAALKLEYLEPEKREA